MTNILFGSHIHDMETCYKLMPGDVARALPMEGRRFEIEPEITSCILQAGYTIFEVPISYNPREEKKLGSLERWLACPGYVIAPSFP